MDLFLAWATAWLGQRCPPALVPGDAAERNGAFRMDL